MGCGPVTEGAPFHHQRGQSGKEMRTMHSGLPVPMGTWISWFTRKGDRQSQNGGAERRCFDQLEHRFKSSGFLLCRLFASSQQEENLANCSTAPQNPQQMPGQRHHVCSLHLLAESREEPAP